MTLTVRGEKELEKHLKKVKNPEKLFDGEVRKTALSSLRRILETTPKDSGDTSRSWTRPRKLGLSRFMVKNDKKTPDKKHLLAEILDKGRGIVRPVKASRLYIPLSNSGKSKPIGGPIPPSLKWGKDFVLAKSAKAYRGTKYLTLAIETAERELQRRILKKLDRV